MIVCPNCSHQNPDGAVQCEACYTPLPATMNCPNCGTSVQTDASFCGQCGFNLRGAGVPAGSGTEPPPPLGVAPLSTPDPVTIDPLVPPDPIIAAANPLPPLVEPPPPVPVPPPPVPVSNQPAPAERPTTAVMPVAVPGPKTQLQQHTARLLHVQTSTPIELPQNLAVIHIGKPNDRIPPDVDVSGFPDSEIVSRIHADIRLEGDTFYIEDVGSSNGTYVNNAPLPMGNRHRLRPGDRIALGKGDKVTFLFQLT